MHGEKPHVETDEHDPEAPFAHLLVHHPAGEFGKPVIDAAHDRKYVDAKQDIMQMRDDKIGFVKLPIKRYGCRHHAGQAADHEQHHKPGEK